MTSARHVGFTVTGLISCLLCFELTPIDLWLQQALYDGESARWAWNRSEPIARFVFYDGPKAVLVILALSLLIALIYVRRLPKLLPYARGLRIVLLSLALVPTVVAGLKQTNSVACPRDLIQFGGQAAYSSLSEAFFPSGQQPRAPRPCFPAAHASGGFALMSLFFLFETPRNRVRALTLALAAGWTMGVYKMLIGDHFLSHTLVSMLIAWLVINLVALSDRKLSKFQQEPDRRHRR